MKQVYVYYGIDRWGGGGVKVVLGGENLFGYKVNKNEDRSSFLVDGINTWFKGLFSAAQKSKLRQIRVLT